MSAVCVKSSQKHAYHTRSIQGVLTVVLKPQSLSSGHVGRTFTAQDAVAMPLSMSMHTNDSYTFDEKSGELFETGEYHLNRRFQTNRRKSPICLS